MQLHFMIVKLIALIIFIIIITIILKILKIISLILMKMKIKCPFLIIIIKIIKMTTKRLTINITISNPIMELDENYYYVIKQKKINKMSIVT